MIHIYKYLFLMPLIIPTVLYPMWISSVGGPLNPVYANAPITQMYNAAKAGYIAQVKSLIGRVQLNELDPASGMTPLMGAAYGGHSEIVLMLLDAGADPNGRDAGGWTALRCILRAGDRNIMQMLIDRGTDLYNCEGRNGASALCIASRLSLNPVPACSLIVDALLQPVNEQKKRFYTFLNCLKQIAPGFGPVGLRKVLFKPLLQEMIKEPLEKVRQEIEKLSAGELKQKLLEKYAF